MTLSTETLVATLQSVRDEGSQLAAAQALGINQSTVQRRLKKATELGLVDLLNDQLAEKQLMNDSQEHGFIAEDVSGYWVKVKDGNSYYVRCNRPDAPSYPVFKDELIAEMQAHSPKYDRAVIDPYAEHLLVLNPADVHIDKLCMIDETGHNYTAAIAVQRMRQGIMAAVGKARLHGTKQVLLTIGNDIMHFDTPFKKTTAGTHQDSSGEQWWSMFQIAKAAFIEMIEALAQEFEVTLCLVPSNHDYTSSYYLADTLLSWFHNHPSVSFGYNNNLATIKHRKYVEFGCQLIGLTHGDGAKESELASLMQFEAREPWGRVKYGYWYTAHLHHKRRFVLAPTKQRLEKDLNGVTIISNYSPEMTDEAIWGETMRSPSPADGWHNRNGYENMCAVESFLHHPWKAQVGRFTEFF